MENSDLITAVNDQKVEAVSDLRKAVDDSIKAAPNKEVKLVIRRGNEAETQSISIKPSPPTSAPAK